MTAAPAPRPFGRYLLLGRLAYGGMSEVHLAEPNETPGERVALKLLLPHLAAEPDFVRLFVEEAQLGARLRHANIVQVLDFGEVEGRHFLVMEYLSGSDLGRVSERLGAQGRAFPLDVALAITRAICDALHFAHELRQEETPLEIVHHDVNPENILLTEAGEVKLIDFGVARPALSPGTGVARGKVAYAAPEQLAGRPVDRRADVFALGVVLHELLTGQRLFKRATEPATLLAVVDAPIPRPSELRPELPRALDDVVARALERDPERRFRSADELGAALETLRPPESGELAELVRRLLQG